MTHLPPTALLALRRVLRRLAREVDGRVALIRRRDEVVEYDGDEHALPRAFPWIDSSVPSVHRTACRDGEQLVASARVRLTRGLPPYDLYVVDPSVPNEALFEALDEAVEAVEDVVFGAMYGNARRSAAT